MANPILLVEDEPVMAALLRQGLEEEGYLVEWVLTGEEALARLEHLEPALLVLDVRLPGMDGVEVCRQVRQRWPDLPVLMLTALDDVENRVRGLRAGADDYLPKPFAFEELLARIEALLRRSKRQPTRHLLSTVRSRSTLTPAPLPVANARFPLRRANSICWPT